MEADDVALGGLVFGRVPGFPFWPGIISKSHQSQEWRQAGKVWVNFFNDKTGAWLKGSEIRPFDSYHKQLCLEQNELTPKFRRYRERIESAIQMANAYETKSTPKLGKQSSSRRRRKPPSPPQSDEVVYISEGNDDEEAKLAAQASIGKRIKSGKSVLTRRQRTRQLSAEEGNNVIDGNVKENEDDDGDADGNSGRNEDGRPRRKRMRSSRYEEFVPINAERKLGRRRSPRQGSHDDVGDLAIEKEVDVNGFGSGKQRSSRTELKKTREQRGKGTKSKPPDPPQGSTKQVSRQRTKSSKKPRDDEGENANTDRYKHTELPNSTHPPAHVAKKTVSRAAGRRSTKQNTNLGNTAVMRELYISELANLVDSKPAKKAHRSGLGLSVPRKSVRSRAIGSSDDTSHREEGTDSEEEPEKERKVRTGSLEAAADDLVEYAVRESRQKESGLKDDELEEHDILGMQAVPLGGSELVCSMLNRISDLERDVTLLKSNAMRQEVATLGEDASAAGLKSAVEALVSASSAFAKARDYDPSAITRSLDILWNDGYFPLTGADGDILKVLVRSLVYASYKRRRAQVEMKQHTEQKPQIDRMSVRQNTQEQEAPQAAGQAKHSAHHHEICQKSPRKRKGSSTIDEHTNGGVEITDAPSKRRRTHVEKANVPNGDNKLKLRIKVPSTLEGKKGRRKSKGMEVQVQADAPRITFKPETNANGDVEVVEEEVLSEEGIEEDSGSERQRDIEEREGSHESEEIMDGGTLPDSDES